MKKYLLVQRNYEYNDEIYSATEGCDPLLIFADKIQAEKEALKRNKKWFEDNDLGQYCYDIKEALPYRSFNMAIRKLRDVGIDYLEEKDRYGNQLVLPKKLNDKQVELLVDLIGFLPVYYVEEIEYVE